MAGKTEVLMRWMCSCLLFLASFGCRAQCNVQALVAEFSDGYRRLNVPALEYDYHSYLAGIPSEGELKKQEVFFSTMLDKLGDCKRDILDKENKILYDHLAYEIENNRERVRLQKQFKGAIPEGGLQPLGGAYYTWLIRQYTSTDISPEAVYDMGQSEVNRVKQEIAAIRKEVKLEDSVRFYSYLKSDKFYVTDKKELLGRFEIIDRTVREHLASFVKLENIPPVYAMEWPGANANTPPGMYLNESNNPYGKDVFQFNFYGQRYNWRAAEWLYMHEAIPGHHLQFSLAGDRNLLGSTFFYPGNFEGWGCYVEYYGKELGLYGDAYSHLGKWEWDLVRSARLVIDVGIHYYGWTREKALAYWKEAIPNQDDIADREVTRVTNWPGQALSYKVGAAKIFELQREWLKRDASRTLRDFNTLFLSFGRVPLAVIEKNILV